MTNKITSTTSVSVNKKKGTQKVTTLNCDMEKITFEVPFPGTTIHENWCGEDKQMEVYKAPFEICKVRIRDENGDECPVYEDGYQGSAPALPNIESVEAWFENAIKKYGLYKRPIIKHGGKDPSVTEEQFWVTLDNEEKWEFEVYDNEGALVW